MNKVSSFNGKNFPAIILADLLHNSENIKNVALVIEWNNEVQGSKWATIFSDGMEPESAAMYVALLENSFREGFIGTSFKSHELPPSAE